MYERMSPGGIDYSPYRFERSKLQFRGPRPDLNEPFVAFLGSTETYGKFIARPFPAQIERRLGMACANFGCMNAGVDVFLGDPPTLEACSAARVTVVAVMGAHNLTNRFYAVHPRRNDRFIRASAFMKTVFQEVDFTEFHFTRHMLQTIKRSAPQKFEMLVDELQTAWIGRMTSLLEQIHSRKVLLWLSDRPIAAAAAPAGPGELGHDPLFVTARMIDALRPMVSDVVECVVPLQNLPPQIDQMVFAEVEASAAREVPGPAAHEAVAAALAGPLRTLAA
jgi:hypothetical protein